MLALSIGWIFARFCSGLGKSWGLAAAAAAAATLGDPPRSQEPCWRSGAGPAPGAAEIGWKNTAGPWTETLDRDLARVLQEPAAPTRTRVCATAESLNWFLEAALVVTSLSQNAWLPARRHQSRPGLRQTPLNSSKNVHLDPEPRLDGDLVRGPLGEWRVFVAGEAAPELALVGQHRRS